MGSRLFGFMEQSRVPGLAQFLHGYKWIEFRIVHTGTPIHISMTWATSRKNSRRQCPEVLDPRSHLLVTREKAGSGKGSRAAGGSVIHSELLRKGVQ